MEIIQEPLSGLFVIKPRVFADHRGHFFESFRHDFVEKLNLHAEFVQDNQSLSNSRIVRGLHFQAPPYAQDKLVRVVTGAVLDVVVDIRKSSPTYGRHFSIELTADNFLMVLIPKGFAHGFVTLQDQTIFQYKCTEYYHPEAEGGILWKSPSLNINWQVENPVLSAKDELHPEFSGFNSPFD
ncbi:MAG: dTDP-4-dehydrorhamnose 3,5-epimerase [Bacteroidetes bacterium]|nr:dTDP-4-dehydrorhamnose 3,5-epimerase [Bacteroidota bacterium]